MWDIELLFKVTGKSKMKRCSMCSMQVVYQSTSCLVVGVSKLAHLSGVCDLDQVKYVPLSLFTGYCHMMDTVYSAAGEVLATV